MKPRTRLLLALASVLVVGYVAAGLLLGRALGDSTYGQLAVFNEVIRTVMDAYVDPIDVDRAMAGARTGLTDALDGDSAYLTADEFKAWEQGVKADGDIGAVVTRRFSFLAVVSVLPGSPAEKAGLKPGDIIKTIDGKHTRSIAGPVGQRLLTGAVGTPVKLTLLRANTDPVDMTINRERLAMPAISAKTLSPGVLYVRVPQIGPKTADELRTVLETQKKTGARQLVLDLRNAGWGNPADGPALANVFVKDGVLARISGSKVPERVLKAETAKAAWSEPMVVLVDLGTIGPAEVAASALQESGRAPLVGSHTFGRAAEQKPVPLYDGGLVLTMATWRNAKNVAIHGKGLEPDAAVDVEAAKEAAPEGATIDPILDKGVEVLKDPTAVTKKKDKAA